MLSEGCALARARLTQAGMAASPTQPVTPGTGNSCMFHALLDQMRHHQPGLANIAVSVTQLRIKLVQTGYNSIKAGKLHWPSTDSLEQWKDAMGREGTMGDQIILQAASNLLLRDIVILPVFHDASHDPVAGITRISPTCSAPPASCSPIFLLYYSESRFQNPHYQSIVPTVKPHPLTEYVRHKRKEEEENNLISLCDKVPNPPTNELTRPSSSSSMSSMSSSVSSPASSSSSSYNSSSSSLPSSTSSYSNSSPSPSPFFNEQKRYVIGTEVQGLGRQTRI